MKRDDLLVWVDLEMTGLEIQHDVILEISTIITDGNLGIIAEGPSLVIHHSDSVVQTMNSWCQKQHYQSGLAEAVKVSKTSCQEAEVQTLEFIQTYCKKNSARLCGNSIWQDRIFLTKYMPSIIEYLNYRMIDVSSIKEVIKRWFPHNPYIDFKKQDTHRALIDIKESIAELQHYRLYFFTCPEVSKS